MIEWLVLSAAFKAVVPGMPGELGSIPRRSRNDWVPWLPEISGKWGLLGAPTN